MTPEQLILKIGEGPLCTHKGRSFRLPVFVYAHIAVRKYAVGNKIGASDAARHMYEASYECKAMFPHTYRKHVSGIQTYIDQLFGLLNGH